MPAGAGNLTLAFQGRRGAAHTQRLRTQAALRRMPDSQGTVRNILKSCITDWSLLYTELEQEPKMPLVQTLSHHWYTLTCFLQSSPSPQSPCRTGTSLNFPSKGSSVQAHKQPQQHWDFADGKYITTHYKWCSIYSPSEMSLAKPNMLLSRRVVEEIQDAKTRLWALLPSTASLGCSVSQSAHRPEAEMALPHSYQLRGK